MSIPITNLETKKISGVKKNTFAYFHEKAHLEFNKSNFGQNVQWTGQMCEFFTIIFLVCGFFFYPFKYFAVCTMLGMIFIFVYEEIWCNYIAYVYEEIWRNYIAYGKMNKEARKEHEF